MVVELHTTKTMVDKVLESFKNKIKNIYEKRDSLFQPTQTKSALKNFTIQRRIKGSNGYDPQSFLLNSKKPITNLMINQRQTKVKLILSCMMEKVDQKSGEVIAKEAPFHSKTEVNLESTVSNERIVFENERNCFGVLSKISKTKK